MASYSRASKQISSLLQQDGNNRLLWRLNASPKLDFRLRWCEERRQLSSEFWVAVAELFQEGGASLGIQLHGLAVGPSPTLSVMIVLPGTVASVLRVLRVGIGAETADMAKRNLRVIKWLGMVPAVGLCTSCNRQFQASMTELKKIADAQESLRRQFSEHNCNADEVNQSAERVVKDEG